MAVYRPSPQPPANLTASGQLSQFHHSTPTPPPISKRDKRRNAMMDRLHEISANFAENREYHYRRQLQALQRDMNLITYAEPYKNQPLDELIDDADDDVSMSATGLRGGQLGGTAGAGDRQPKAGKWGRRFIEEVNNAMEDRDAQLSLVAVSQMSAGSSTAVVPVAFTQHCCGRFKRDSKRLTFHIGTTQFPRPRTV